ncbi:MAG TPA: CDP-diacylglycerol--serine O-phosphatidyltransferase [Bacteroidales bacterium]|nr:CDP-diacylglycerol--serine O-phosphatidyltransferase [Bacteroidales bacterium]
MVPSKSTAILMDLKLIIQTLLIAANLIISPDQLKFILNLLPLTTWHNVTAMKHIPNFITSLNLAAGFAAIIFTTNGDLITASWLIVAAMVFDFLDGFSARMLKAYSATGKELDSLADVVSFGVAPGLIIYKLLAVSAGNLSEFSGFKGILIYIVVLMPVCAALRLAKFNIDTTQTTFFKGLPTPANAIAVISVVLAAHYSPQPLLKTLTGSLSVLIAYSVVLSFLMVTRIPLLSLKFKNVGFSGNEGRYILLGIILILFILFRYAAAPMIIPVYIIVSLISPPK